jgi:general secretion pathway protein A
VLQQLDRRTFAAFVPDPFVSREDLLKTLLLDFGVISIDDLTRGRFNGASRSDLSYPLYEFLDSLVPLQAFAVLVIDEAQNLSLGLLEEIRILSELERREKLLQVVLVGQPELRASLKLPQMRQVDQRVSVRCELTALDANGTAGYVNHRLSVAGGGDRRVEFTHAALGAIHRGSSGVPRLINRICDRALDRAHKEQSPRVDESFVWGAIDDLGLTPAPSVRERAEPIPFPAAKPSAVVGAATDSELKMLTDFAPESDRAGAASASAAPSANWSTWVAGAVASLIAFSASVVGVAWYLDAQTVIAAPLLPPRPAVTSLQSVSDLARTAASVAESLQTDPAAPGATSRPAPGGGYSIVVASFSARDRAERLVEELTSAGFRAQAVERDWGPPRGRLVQVNVGSYDSAIEVQRDLQRIRELPGGYSDARLVERR